MKSSAYVTSDGMPHFAESGGIGEIKVMKNLAQFCAWRSEDTEEGKGRTFTFARHYSMHAHRTRSAKARSKTRSIGTSFVVCRWQLNKTLIQRDVMRALSSPFLITNTAWLFFNAPK